LPFPPALGARLSYETAHPTDTPQASCTPLVSRLGARATSTDLEAKLAVLVRYWNRGKLVAIQMQKSLVRIQKTYSAYSKKLINVVQKLRIRTKQKVSELEDKLLDLEVTAAETERAEAKKQ
jgi:hypothetical protein